MANIPKQSKRKFHIIYQTTNCSNNMIYIGAHSTDLLEDGYLGSGHRLTLAIEKYGIEKFKREILYIFENPIEMFNKEAELVNDKFLKRPDVYNIVTGGFGGYNKGTTGLKHMSHPKTGQRCAVHPNAISPMIEEGWVIGRNMSSTTDTVWIHSLLEKKMVKHSELSKYLSDGWKKGLPKSPTSGKVWIYNSSLDEYSLCEKNELTDKLNSGWIKKKWAPVKKGSAWINNGVENLRISKDVLSDYLVNGWKSGMITTRWN